MIPERLAALRQEMEKRDIAVYIVPTADFHESEYVGEYFKARRFITGFTGSAGTAVITRTKAGLWTDGRYFVQAAKQLEGTTVTLYRMGEEHVPTVDEYVEQTLKEGQLVLLQLAPVDPRSLMQGDYMRLNYKEANSELINRQEAKRGYAVLKLDKNHVGEIIRLQESLEPVNENEIVLKYKTINGRLFLGAESFFFEEGQDSVYNRAAYGGLRVDNKGQSLLVGLYDGDFRQIKPYRGK